MLHNSAPGFSFGKLGPSILTACCVALNLSNCNTQPPKTPDTTPPTIRWNVRNSSTGEARDISGSGVVAARFGEGHAVMCVVNDPEGVHEITLGGGGSYQCTGQGLGQSGTFGDTRDKQTLNPDADGKVLPQIFLIRNFNFVFTCNSGLNFSGGSLSLACNGLNHNKGSVSGTLTINITP